MELTDEQKNAVRLWAREGLGLSDIQKQLESEFGLKMTYMDVRFLVIDLEAELQDKEDTSRKPDIEPDTTPGMPDAGTMSPPSATENDAFGGGTGSGVSVQLDKLQKPGLLVSGSVTFSDGTSATWGLDQMGRLVLDAGDPTYKPSDEDIAAFQMELRNLLAQRGY